MMYTWLLWGQTAMYDVFDDIDKSFGFKRVYKFSHIFPRSCLLIHQLRFKPPKMAPDGLPCPGSNVMFGAETLFQGLKQKPWTLCTWAFQKLAAYEYQLSTETICQGDNQGCLINYEQEKNNNDRVKDLSADELINLFIHALEAISNRSGVKLKRLESWASSVLFEYNKKKFLFGSEVPRTLRLISKLTSQPNSVFQSINVEIASIFTCGATAASSNFEPISCYLTACFSAASHLLARFEVLRSLRSEELTVLLLTTRELGGFPVSLMPSFCYRGIVDPLSNNISVLMSAVSFSSDIASAVHRMVDVTQSRRLDYSMLVQDPYSINISTPRQPENLLRDELEIVLAKVSNNVIVSSLLSDGATYEKDVLIHDLMSIRPVMPRVFNYIYARSNSCH